MDTDTDTCAEPQVDVLHLVYGGLGGHAPVVTTLTRSLSQLGFKSGVLAYGDGLALKENSAAWENVPVVIPIEMEGRVDLTAWRKVYGLVRKLRPRVVLCHTHKFAIPIWAAVRRTVPRQSRCILVEHQSIDLRSKADNLRSGISLPLVDSVVFLSADYKARYPFRRLPLSSIKRSVIIPNGVDTAEFSPPQDRPTGSEFRIGMASRLTVTKDLATLIRAIQELNASDSSASVHLDVAGTGPQLSEFQTLVGELGLESSVTFVGHVIGDELSHFYRGLDAYVHSTYGETASTAILQAMATELPIVGSDVIGVNDLVQHDRTGLLVPSQDPSAVARAINTLRNERALRIRLGTAGRSDVVARFSAASSTTAYLRLFSSIDPFGPWSRGYDVTRSTGTSDPP